MGIKGGWRSGVGSWNRSVREGKEVQQELTDSCEYIPYLIETY